MHVERFRRLESASAKTGWSGTWSRYCFQKWSRIAASLAWSGFISPQKMWVWLFITRYSHQSRNRSTGTNSSLPSSPVSSRDWGIGNASWCFPTRSLLQSRSAFCSERLDKSTRPGDRLAAATPTSATTALAARTTAAHAALGHRAKASEGGKKGKPKGGCYKSVTLG